MPLMRCRPKKADGEEEQVQHPLESDLGVNTEALRMAGRPNSPEVRAWPEKTFQRPGGKRS